MALLKHKLPHQSHDCRTN